MKVKKLFAKVKNRSIDGLLYYVWSKRIIR